MQSSNASAAHYFIITFLLFFIFWQTFYHPSEGLRVETSQYIITYCYCSCNYSCFAPMCEYFTIKKHVVWLNKKFTVIANIHIRMNLMGSYSPEIDDSRGAVHKSRHADRGPQSFISCTDCKAPYVSTTPRWFYSTWSKRWMESLYLQDFFLYRHYFHRVIRIVIALQSCLYTNCNLNKIDYFISVHLSTMYQSCHVLFDSME